MIISSHGPWQGDLRNLWKVARKLIDVLERVAGSRNWGCSANSNKFLIFHELNHHEISPFRTSPELQQIICLRLQDYKSKAVVNFVSLLSSSFQFALQFAKYVDRWTLVATSSLTRTRLRLLISLVPWIMAQPCSRLTKSGGLFQGHEVKPLLTASTGNLLWWSSQ
jgi:hypothetical protein